MRNFTLTGLTIKGILCLRLCPVAPSALLAPQAPKPTLPPKALRTFVRKLPSPYPAQSLAISGGEAVHIP